MRNCTYHCRLIMQPLAAIDLSGCCLGRSDADRRQLYASAAALTRGAHEELSRAETLLADDHYGRRKGMEDGWRRRGRALAI